MSLTSGAFEFAHGTGHVRWPDSTRSLVQGECVDGLMEGRWGTDRGGLRRDVDYVHGTMQGAVRAELEAGEVVEEGIVDQRVWTAWRGSVAGACVMSRREKARGKVVVEEVCLRFVQRFEVSAACSTATQCAYERITADGRVPLTDDERGLVRLPPIEQNRTCPEPDEAALRYGIETPTVWR